MEKAELLTKTRLITKSFENKNERDDWVRKVLDDGYYENENGKSFYWPKWSISKVTIWEE